ncbi:MAG: ABC transporter permease [Blautia sp.]|nr:ABC transporter permease [Blautia sp.]
MKNQRTKDIIRTYGALIVLIALLVLNGFITPNFIHINTMWNLLIQSFSVIIISLGMTMVIATGGIDISVGSTMALSSILFAKLLIQQERNIILCLLAALLAAAVFGLFNGILVGVFDIQPIVATLILMIAGRGIAQQFNNGVVLSFYGNPFAQIGIYRIAGKVPIQLPMAAAAVLIILFVVRKTAFGTYVQAVGDNKTASRLVGLRTSRVLIITYVSCALLAGLAACFETLRLCSADPNNIGSGIELDCVAAVAIGGTKMSGGKAVIWGTVVGALVMQLITTMMNMNNIFYAYGLVIKAVIIILALYLQRENDK